MKDQRVLAFLVLIIIFIFGAIFQLNKPSSGKSTEGNVKTLIIQDISQNAMQPFLDREVETVIGNEDKTIISRESSKETDDSYIFTISIVSRDNNFEGDGNGGKIEFINAQVIDVITEDWEENCKTNNDFSYECFKLTNGNKTFQWFNFVFGNEDRLKLVVKVPNQETSFINILEAGGMECGAYFQTAQSGTYRGYSDGSGGLACSAKKTFLGNKRISDFGGFPLIAPLVAYNEEKIIIPVKVHLIKSSQLYTSERTEENTRNIFSKVNLVWSQAGIEFKIKEIVSTNIDESILTSAISGNPIGLTDVTNYDENAINALFSKYIGANGIAFPLQKSILIADKTTVYDFRATSHELGHILGLQHVVPKDRLLAEGVNGFILTEAEIKTARKNAINYS